MFASQAKCRGFESHRPLQVSRKKRVALRRSALDPVTVSDAPRRPILKLKLAPKPPVAPEPAAPQAAPSVPSAPKWKCKPCGAVFSLTGLEKPDDEIRCAACNARLGKAEAFTADGEGEPKVRARRLSERPA